jgi:hypothetical protein
LLEASPTHNHRRQRNINVRAALIHVIGDFVQSIGVFLAAVLIYFQVLIVVLTNLCLLVLSNQIIVICIAAIMVDCRSDLYIYIFITRSTNNVQRNARRTQRTHGR